MNDTQLRDTADLQDDGRIIGSESATLFIFDLQASDAGVYDCLVTDTAGCFAISDPATLTVLGTCPAEGDCPADLNADGIVDPFDLVTVLAAWGPCS